MVMTTESTRAPEADYLAVIPIGGGCSWGRGSDKVEAVNNAVRQLRDWETLFVVSNIQVSVNVIEVTGYGECNWGYGPVRGVNKVTGKDEPIDRPVEQVKAFTPKWRKRR
jgi:hypothetical protein